MKVISFALYYIKLQVQVAFGFHFTSHPLDLNWRWSYWQRREESRRRREAYAKAAAGREQAAGGVIWAPEQCSSAGNATN